LLAMAATFSVVFSLHADNGSAAITDMEGDVQVKKAGQAEFIDADVDMELQVGDMIVTKDKSEAEVVFDDDNSVIKLEPNTTVILRKIEKTKVSRSSLIEMTLGKIITMMKHDDGLEKSFEVKTPSAIAAVKGTEFAVEALAGESYVGVFDGEVKVSAYDLNGEKLHDVPVKKEKGMTVKLNSRSYVPNSLRHDWKTLVFAAKVNQVRKNIVLYRELKKSGMWVKIQEARRAARVRDVMDWAAKNPGKFDKLPAERKAQLKAYIEANKHLKDLKIDELRKKYPLLIDRYRELQRQRMERLNELRQDRDQDKDKPARPDPSRRKR